MTCATLYGVAENQGFGLLFVVTLLFMLIILTVHTAPQKQSHIHLSLYDAALRVKRMS